MRRTVPVMAAALLAMAACASSVKPAAQAPPAVTSASGSPVPVPSAAPTSASPLPALSPSTSPTQAASASGAVAGGQTVVAVPAARLPYPPAQGAPALDDVTIIKSDTEPCGIPADNSGNEAQLIDAARVATVISVTFEVTNPCTTVLSYDVTVTQAIGAADGPSAGPALQTTTQEIHPGASVKFKANIDPRATLTPTQRQQLWVGVTHIAKHAR